MAIVDGEIIGGGVFFCDGNSMRYWHGAASRAFSRYFPTCAVVAHAIRHSCEIGKKSFGFGGSMGKESLEAFKSYWGAKRREYWEFEWRNPIWISLSNLRAKLGGFLD
jgi:lipid II:glycine glycyltransferase (peptidoglycan interpeptide bridge formation enzyme)